MSADRRTLLIIEDDPDIRESLRDVLEAEGFQVHTAENGQQGMDQLRTIEPPCLILLDLMMPVMSGAEFLTALRQMEGLAALPVVIVSAVSQEASKVAEQAQGFVKKPVTLDALLDAVERHCGGQP